MVDEGVDLRTLLSVGETVEDMVDHVSRYDFPDSVARDRPSKCLVPSKRLLQLFSIF